MKLLAFQTLFYFLFERKEFIMGGGRRVLTQLEQNAEYLREYSNFIKNIKHLDLEKQEIELKEESVEAANYLLSCVIIKNLSDENKIKLKLLKIIFESDDFITMLNCCNLRRIRWMIYRGYDVGFTLEKLENLIQHLAKESLIYALEIKDRFEKGEKAIAESDEIDFIPNDKVYPVTVLPSLEYAKIIKGRFELGEKKIMQKTKWIYEYSKIVGMLPEEMHNMLIASCL
jgi:hypothetical protein